MNIPPFSGPVLAVLLTFGAAGGAGADVMCVETAAELQLALAFAAVNGEGDEIRIAAGTYPAPSGGFVYDATVGGGDAHALTLSGGWSKVFGICVASTLDPAATRLEGGGSERVMTIRLRGIGDLTVHRLTFAGGFSAGTGAGLRIMPANGYAGSVVAERNRFIDNQSHSGSGLSIGFDGASAGTGAGARYRVVNNLFVMNEASVGCGAASIVTRNPDPVPIGGPPEPETPGGYRSAPGGSPPVNAEVVIGNNTAAANTSGDNAAGGICLLSDVAVRLVANNNLWGNQGADLVTLGGGYSLYNNNLGIHVSPDPPGEEADNLSVFPQYGPCLGEHCWIPLPDSPLIDAGLDPAPPLDGWLGDYDLRGLARVSGGTLDIGAYEGEWDIFSDRFEN